jgi:hypothetical protein
VLGADERFGVIMLGDDKGNMRRVMAERLYRANPELRTGTSWPSMSDPGPGKVNLPKDAVAGVGENISPDGWDLVKIDLVTENVRVRKVVDGAPVDLEVSLDALAHTPGERDRLHKLVDGQELRTGDADEHAELLGTFFRNERERRIDGVPDADAPDKYRGTPNKMLDSDLMRGVTYLRTNRERAPFEVTIKDGKLYKADGKLLDTKSFESHWGGEGSAIFVMSKSGKLYVSPQEVGKFHHSSLLAGDDVAAAGTLSVKKGRITEISDQSGHYLPKVEISAQFLKELKAQGVDLGTITFSSMALRPSGQQQLPMFNAEDFLRTHGGGSTP